MTTPLKPVIFNTEDKSKDNTLHYIFTCDYAVRTLL